MALCLDKFGYLPFLPVAFTHRKWLLKRSIDSEECHVSERFITRGIQKRVGERIMRLSLVYFAVACSLLVIRTNTIRAVDGVLPDENIGIISAEIETPTTKQDIGDNITITTSIKVASKC